MWNKELITTLSQQKVPTFIIISPIYFENVKIMIQ